MGYSSTGYNGPYTTAITQDGAIVADFIAAGTLNCALLKVINLVAQGVELTGNFKTTNGNYFASLWAGVFTMGIVSALNPNTENNYVQFSTSSSDPDNGSGRVKVYKFANGQGTLATDIVGENITTGGITASGGITAGGNVYVGGVLQIKNGQIRIQDGQNTLTFNLVRMTNGGADYWVIASPA